MINGKKILSVIPARSGSVGLPKKNILRLCNKPLFAWSLESGNSSKYIDRNIISTNDIELIQCAKEYDADIPFIRPDRLATSTATSYEVVFHAITEIDESYDIIVLLQPTSPLRLCDDIDIAIEMLENSNSECVISVVMNDHPPDFNFTIDPNSILQYISEKQEVGKRRQDYTETYRPNGAVYALYTESLLRHKTFYPENTIAYVMPKERSIDIDDEIDFKFAEYLLSNYKK